MITTLRAAVGIALLAGLAFADSIPNVMFQLDPVNGILAGAAGTSVGWGYTISTDSDFVTIESFSFGDGTPVGIFSTPGVPLSAASSGSPIMTSWIPDIAGLQYDVSASATDGASTQGVMTLIYDAYTDSDLTNQVVFGQSLNATLDGVNDVAAEVDVSGAASAAPEPASGVSLLASVAVAALWQLRLRRSKEDLARGSAS